MPLVLERFSRALVPDGTLYASFKRGSGENRRDGRLFNDCTLQGAQEMLENGGLFRVEEAFESADVRPEYTRMPWINIFARPAGGSRRFDTV